MENYDVEQVKPVLNQITNISQTDKQYATGIIGRTLKQIDAKIAPSVLTKGIPTITFESFSKIFSKNKRKVNGNDILNYVYNPFFDDYGVVICSKENDSLIFGYFKEINKKLKVDKIINNNMNEEFIAAVTEIILEEITKNKTKIIEFNRKSFGDIFVDIKDILEKNGYYYNKKSNISGYFVFEDGLDKINEMEDWDFMEKDQQEKSIDGDLSPLSITLEKKPDTGMNESLSQQDQTDVTAAIGILSSELTKDQNAKNNTVDSSLTKLTPNQKDALKRTAPQSMTNSKNLGDLVTNVGKELTSKGDTIASDRQDTNKNKEVVKPYGTEQPIKPNTNGINY